MTITTLINEPDAFEVVRDQIAGILRTEFLAQQVLAAAASEDPLEWTVDVMVEREFPVERWRSAGPELTTATVPVVTISLESTTWSAKKSSAPGGRQIFEAIYLIDSLARGVSADEAGDGYEAADKAAHLNCHRTVRLVRNILRATQYRQLGLKGIVWGHVRFQSFEYGAAPVEDQRRGTSVWNGRGRFVVEMFESSIQTAAPNILEIIAIDISDDGGVILQTEIP